MSPPFSSFSMDPYSGVQEENETTFVPFDNLPSFLTQQNADDISEFEAELWNMSLNDVQDEAEDMKRMWLPVHDEVQSKTGETSTDLEIDRLSQKDCDHVVPSKTRPSEKQCDSPIREPESNTAHLEEDEEMLDCTDIKNLPPHACCYCGISIPDCVMRCDAKGCKRWFCNSNFRTCGSHIINHLVKSKHKEVSLHMDSVLGETALECYNCGGRNIFLLGFIPAAEEGVMVLICREPCLSHNSMKDSNWNLDKWQPLIEERAVLSWLVRIPKKKTLMRARPVTTGQIRKLEQLWLTDPNATMQDLQKPTSNDEIKSVQLRYQDAVQYQNIFVPLLQMEAAYEKLIKDSLKQTNVTVRWGLGLNMKHYAYFIYSEETEFRLTVSDELRLSCSYGVDESWYGVGVISRVSNTEEVALELRSFTVPTPWSRNVTTGFTAEFVWKPIRFERCYDAMYFFAEDTTSVSGYLYHKLLGFDVEDQVIKTSLPQHFSAPNLAQLNHSQAYAVQKALQTPLCLIQGPPGTGKTLTSATLVYHLAKRRNGQILVAAPSNVAVDQLAERIQMTGLKVVRLFAKSREAVQSSVDYLALRNQIQGIIKSDKDEYNKLVKLTEEIGELSQQDEKRLKDLSAAYEMEVLEAADVICTTCIGAGDVRLRNFRFRQVLIDEATQASEPEFLVPIVLGTKQLILVGDHCQLGPLVMSKEATNAGLSQSMFERLVLLGIRPIRLEVQYRMHPCLSEFPSAAFYDGSLQNGVTLQERVYKSLDFPWPRPDMPMFFYHSTGLEEISASGTSYLNRTEASFIEKMVTYLLKGGLSQSQIGVVTPYDGQRSYISTLFQRQSSLGQLSYTDIEVASVDAFQGREKDFILLSCVRSNKGLGIGFLHDPRRLNVALTRAKYGLVICGNAKVLAKQQPGSESQIYCNLLNHFKKYNLVVEGSITNLRPSNITFAKPKKIQPRSRPFIGSNAISKEEMQDYDRGICHTRVSSGTAFATHQSDSHPCMTSMNLFQSPGMSLDAAIKKEQSNFNSFVHAPEKYFGHSQVVPKGSRASRGRGRAFKKSGMTEASLSTDNSCQLSQVFDNHFMSQEHAMDDLCTNISEVAH